jgi:hypothetical protein
MAVKGARPLFPESPESLPTIAVQEIPAGDAPATRRLKFADLKQARTGSHKKLIAPGKNTARLAHHPPFLHNLCAEDLHKISLPCGEGSGPWGKAAHKVMNPPGFPLPPDPSVLLVKLGSKGSIGWLGLGLNFPAPKFFHGLHG